MPALAAGNAVVLKPASIEPGVALELAKALDEAGLPNGVLNIVTGPGSAVSTEFIEHDAVNAVSFTRSSEVGQIVYDQATDTGMRV